MGAAVRFLLVLALVPLACAPSAAPTVRPDLSRVSGRLVTASGAPAAGVAVCLQTCPAATTTDAEGRFSVDVPRGDIAWRFVYVVDGEEKGEQMVSGLATAAYELPPYAIAP